MWLITIILAYFFFSLASLGDKFILAGTPKPKAYTFFVGISNIAIIFLIPFINFSFPELKILPWIILEAMIFIFGLYVMYSALEKFDVSRVATTMGAAQPVLILFLSWIVWGTGTISKTNILAFILLLLGTVIISMGKNYKATGGYLKITLFASLIFSLDYILTKIIFLSQPFLLGLFWMRIFAFFFALLILIPKKNRTEILGKRDILNKKTGTIFVLTNASGGIATLLQAFAISLVPIAFLPILNSLRGIQYVFLFLMTLFLSFFLPKILKEEISKKIILQKIISIILIVGGLAILVL
jgi:drug/metabolite transporter (DMT)-like permease